MSQIFKPEASTPPPPGFVESLTALTGTNPVPPNVSDTIFIATALVSARSTPLTTVGIAGSNTLDIQAQLSTASASSVVNNVGLASFNSSSFSVDANGYVSLVPIPFTSINLVVFNTTQTYTPSAGMVYCIVECIGGGGAGGGAASTGAATVAAGAGGAAGSYARSIFSASTIGASQTVTIGSGGAGASGTGNPGGTTSLGALISAGGGGGGTGSAAGTNSLTNGGNATAATGQFSLFGGAGQAGWGATSLNVIIGGQGGSSVYGAGGKQKTGGAGGAGNGGNGPGAGGGGASQGNSQSGANGGSGSNGLVLITEFINT